MISTALGGSGILVRHHLFVLQKRAEEIGHAVLATTGVLRNNQVHATKVPLLLVAWHVPELILCDSPALCCWSPIARSIYDHPVVTTGSSGG